MRPQRRETAHRPGTGTLPPMERQPRRPPHLGTAPAHRINPAQITPAPAWPPRTATSALGMPSHRTSEYLPSRCREGFGLEPVRVYLPAATARIIDEPRDQSVWDGLCRTPWTQWMRACDGQPAVKRSCHPGPTLARRPLTCTYPRAGDGNRTRTISLGSCWRILVD